MTQTKAFETVSILGVPVSAVNMPVAVGTISDWIARGETRYVCAADVHSISSAQTNDRHLAALQRADMVIPDGTPLTWIGRLRGFRRIERVCGPDLILEVCRQSAEQGWRHYFYGGAAGVAEELARTLQRKYPGLKVAGAESPPFRPLTANEIDAMVERVENAGTDIMWIGLGCPKQEIWMHEHVSRMSGSIVLIGVGAAFDFHTGRVSRAPVWMRNNGMEWLHRLALEPRRLWIRYLVHAPRFLVLSLAETAFGAAAQRKRTPQAHL